MFWGFSRARPLGFVEGVSKRNKKRRITRSSKLEGKRRAPILTVVPTPPDAPLAAGGDPGLSGDLLVELSTLAPSILALRFAFASGFSESGVRRGSDGSGVTCRGARRALFCVDSDVCLVKVLLYQAHTGLIHTLGRRG